LVATLLGGVTNLDSFAGFAGKALNGVSGADDFSTFAVRKRHLFILSVFDCQHLRVGIHLNQAALEDHGALLRRLSDLSRSRLRWWGCASVAGKRRSDDQKNKPSGTISHWNPPRNLSFCDPYLKARYFPHWRKRRSFGITRFSGVQLRS